MKVQRILFLAVKRLVKCIGKSRKSYRQPQGAGEGLWCDLATLARRRPRSPSSSSRVRGGCIVLAFVSYTRVLVVCFAAETAPRTGTKRINARAPDVHRVQDTREPTRPSVHARA